LLLVFFFFFQLCNLCFFYMRISSKLNSIVVALSCS
jgi:hypothetical protein